MRQQHLQKISQFALINTLFEEDASKLVFGGVRVAHRFSFVCGPIMCSYVLSSV